MPIEWKKRPPLHKSAKRSFFGPSGGKSDAADPFLIVPRFSYASAGRGMCPPCGFRRCPERRGGEEKRGEGRREEETRGEDRRGEDMRHCWPTGPIWLICQSGNLARCTNLAMRDGLQFGLSCNLANLAYCSIWPIWRLCQSGNLGSIPIWQQHTPRLKNIRETLQIHIKTQQGARLDSDETKTPDWQPKLANRIGKLNPVNLAIWNQSGRIAFDHLA